MIFHNRQKNIESYDQLKLKINGVPIKRVYFFNFLGIVINENLTWNNHISYISQKISPVVGIINRLKNQLPTRILKMIYNSLILSRLHYGNILWGGNPGSLLRLNKRGLRAITGAGSNTHTIPICKKLNILSLPDIHQTKLLCLYKQHIDNKLPTNIHTIFQEINSSEPQDPRTSAYKSTIRYQLPALIHNAPTELLEKIHSVSYKTFKWKAKTYRLDRYSSLCTDIGCRICHLPVIPDSEKFTKTIPDSITYQTALDMEM